MDDPFNLERFVRAQDFVRGQKPVFEQACAELGGGGKEGHWMWFIFPQMKGLGFSPKSTEFAIRSRNEAEAYLSHPILGPRLRECTRLVNLIEGLSIRDIFPYPDYLKFHSCMTLFAQVPTEAQIFQDALQKYFGGDSDRRTLELL